MQKKNYHFHLFCETNMTTNDEVKFVLRKKKDEDTVTISCPKCGYSTKVGVQDLQIFSRYMRVQCKCRFTFDVKLEFRQERRKIIDLGGLFYNPHESDKWKTYLNTWDSSYVFNSNCRIKDISMHGLKVEVIGSHSLEVGRKLRIRFKLGDTVRHEVEKDVVIRFVKGSFLGCEFLDLEQNSTLIGFYMM